MSEPLQKMLVLPQKMLMLSQKMLMLSQKMLMLLKRCLCSRVACRNSGGNVAATKMGYFAEKNILKVSQKISTLLQKILKPLQKFLELLQKIYVLLQKVLKLLGGCTISAQRRRHLLCVFSSFAVKREHGK